MSVLPISPGWRDRKMAQQWRPFHWLIAGNKICKWIPKVIMNGISSSSVGAYLMITFIHVSIAIVFILTCRKSGFNVEIAFKLAKETLSFKNHWKRHYRYVSIFYVMTFWCHEMDIAFVPNAQNQLQNWCKLSFETTLLFSLSQEIVF